MKTSSSIPPVWENFYEEPHVEKILRCYYTHKTSCSGRKNVEIPKETLRVDPVRGRDDSLILSTQTGGKINMILHLGFNK